MTTVESLIQEAYQEFSGVVKTASGKNLDFDEAKKMSESLQKVASLPYKEDVYGAVCGIMKLASGIISTATSELQRNKDRTEELEKVASVRGLIDEMLENSIISRFDILEKTAALLRKSNRELEIVKEAMAMAPNASQNIFDDSETEKTASLDGGKVGIFDAVMF